MLNTPWYQQAFPNTRIGDQDTQTKFSTTKGGYRLATTPGGSMTGIGADYIILDDPQKASDMMHESSRNDTKFWIDNTVYSRFNDPKKGILIVVMQRLHDDDLIGHILQTNSGWEVIKIPIMAEEDLTFQISDNTTHTFKKGEFLQPELFGQKEFDELRASMGTANFYSQYQQSPVPPAGNIFDWKWFRPAPSPPEYSEVIISLDVAATKAGGNYSAFTVWGHRDYNWHLRAVHRYQYELPEVRTRLLELDKLYRPDVIVVDGQGVGRGLVQELQHQGFKYVLPILGEGKLFDAERIAPTIEGGRVFYLPDAPGLAAFRNEVVAFPKGTYSDQVDSMVQMLKHEGGVVRMARQHKRPERKGISSPPTLNISVKKIYGN